MSYYPKKVWHFEKLPWCLRLMMRPCMQSPWHATVHQKTSVAAAYLYCNNIFRTQWAHQFKFDWRFDSSGWKVIARGCVHAALQPDPDVHSAHSCFDVNVTAVTVLIKRQTLACVASTVWKGPVCLDWRVSGLGNSPAFVQPHFVKGDL